jgi:hypothetical protein
VNVDDVEVCDPLIRALLMAKYGTRTILLVKKGNGLDSLTVDYLPRLFVLFYNKNGKYTSQAHGNVCVRVVGMKSRLQNWVTRLPAGSALIIKVTTF